MRLSIMKDFILCHHTELCLLLAFILDALIGDPERLFHPVRLMGQTISFLEKHLNRPSLSKLRLRFNGALLVLILVLLFGGATFALVFFCYRLHFAAGLAVEFIIGAYCIAARNLHDEVMNVYKELKDSTLDSARKAVARIVGRDTNVLDESGVAKAAVETCAESLNDGVVAPLFYLALGGPVLGIIYKCVNTMDSMVGYKNERYKYFGTAAARTDDVFNFLPSRIAALVSVLSSALLRLDARNAWKVFIRHRYNHQSPNSAQTESVFAGALRVQLAGDAYYQGVLEHKPFIGFPLEQIQNEHIKKADRLMYTTSVLCAVLFAAVRFLIAQAIFY